MDWTRNHLYAISLCAAGLLLIFGALIVANHSPEASQGGVATWNGAPIVPDVPTAQTYQTSVPTHVLPTSIADASTSLNLPYQPQQSPAVPPATAVSDAAATKYDFSALAARISASTSASKPPVSANTSGSRLNSWDFIPHSIISVKTPTSGRTPDQDALYQYGNALGTLIQGYDASHHDQATIIDMSDKDRENAAKSAAVAKIGTDLEAVGENIAAINAIPASVTSQNNALSQSYITVGKKLVAVAQAEAGSDAELVAAIRSYDASMDVFNSNYVALVDAFSLAGVTFSNADPGSVFSFSPSSL